jgi:hypothetical protein
MAAAWRPPEGLVLDGREHGGRFRHAGKAIITAIDTSCFTSHARYSVREAEVGSPAKIVLSASSESLLLPTRSVIDERSGSVAPLCPACLSRRSPLAIMGVRLRVRHQSVWRAGGTRF